MNQLLGALKSCAYIALLISTCVFFSRFQESVNSETPEGVVVTAKTPPTPAAASSPAIKTLEHIGLFLVTAISLAILFAWDLCVFVAHRAVDRLFDFHARPEKVAALDEASQTRRKGYPMEAIEALREHLNARPRDIHASVMIAEIYEFDLLNPLAAVLEYEEMLTWRMSKERWGKLAVRAANLYSGKLKRADRALDLLRETADRCLETPAGQKARKRLAYYDAAVSTWEGIASTTSATC